MEGLSGIDWGGLFSFGVPIAEILVRGTAMYWFLFLIFRFVVRRDIGAVGIGDLLILVIVADAAQNAMAGDAKTIADGMVLVATLIGWNLLLDWMSYRFHWFRRFAEPHALRLVEDGRLLTRNMRKEFITEDELWGKLREAGIGSLDEVQSAYMESDGAISVIRKKQA